MKHMINNNNNNSTILFNPKAMEKTPLLPKRLSSSLPSSTTTSPSNTSSRSIASTETDFSEDNNNFNHKSSSSTKISPISLKSFPSEDALSYKSLAVLSGHAGTVSCLAVCGEFLLSASQGKDIIVWQQPDLKPFAKFGHGDGSVKALVALNNRVFTAHQDSRIRVWKLSRSRASENAFRLVNTLPTTKDYLGKCMIQRNYVQTRRHHKKLWIEHADSISCLAVSDGLVYSGSWDKTVKVWRASDLKCLESIEAHDDAVNAVVNGERGGIVYSASADGKIKAWKRESSSKGSQCHHALKAILEGHKDVSVNSVVVSGDGKWVFGAGSDGYVMVWERKEIRMDGCDDYDDVKWDLVFEVRAHKMAVLSLCLVGEFLCSGSADKTVGIWKRKGFGKLSKVGHILGHEGPVKCLQGLTSGVGLGSGFLLYSGGLDRTLRVWWVPTKSDTSSIEL